MELSGRFASGVAVFHQLLFVYKPFDRREFVIRR